VLDFDRDDIDIAIRFGNGKYPGLRSDLLFQDQVFPVCSPSLITKDKPLKTPRDLIQHHQLIHLDWEAQGLPWPNWRMWMLAAGIRDFDDSAGLHFSLTSLAVQAAINGQGVALGDSNLVADDLAAGRLVKPFELSLRDRIGIDNLAAARRVRGHRGRSDRRDACNDDRIAVLDELVDTNRPKLGVGQAREQQSAQAAQKRQDPHTS
jgi:DNA-binding transcriptional LysR family regulator